MTIFGIDVSHFQGGGDLAAAKKDGVEFVYAKASQGQSIKDSAYHDFYDQAKSNRLLFAAYHFIHSDSPIQNQVNNFLSVAGFDKSVPVVIDCEPYGLSHPTLAHVRLFERLLAKAGMRVSLVYLPGWYHNDLGKPDLRGHSWGLIQSSYGANLSAHFPGNYQGSGDPRWAPVGGVHPGILQYGSQGQVAGFPGHVDVDAYAGSHAELLASGWFKDFASVTPKPHPNPAPKPPVPAPAPVPAPVPPKPTEVSQARVASAEAIRHLESAVAKGRTGRVKIALAAHKAAFRLIP